MDCVRCAALLTLILLLAACSKKDVRGICPYYQNRTNNDDYLNHIRKDTIIFHFSPLFHSGCSTLSRILVCSRLFPFCSTSHFIVLLPRVFHTVLRPNECIANLALDKDGSCPLCCYFDANSAFGCLQ